MHKLIIFSVLLGLALAKPQRHGIGSKVKTKEPKKPRPYFKSKPGTDCEDQKPGKWEDLEFGKYLEACDPDNKARQSKIIYYT